MALSHNTLHNYYANLFGMIQHHKYSITELENLIPFERDIFVNMLTTYLKQIEEERKRRET